ncbi:hypothetical protein BME96_12615 [Virgibacillus halodenitrificans]|uniref:Uncharacterized protein n=1 Tax=Virgibacillus halodenitrificans TaxID=1482 RepID=A0AAC9NKZ3_VIRHA|nr:hypothetical protein [Virgibacillus halodenitrificans]APC48982.1 hypothetical protein BME96_12615 [Virgibacillus halodenitrificans]UUG68573.1 hypothetical protein YPHTV1_00011 [Halomonas phage YPHTV-1]
MAKFNIEVELDWIDEFEDGNLDDTLKEEVISGIQSRLVKKVESEAIQKVSEKVSEKVDQAVDEFLEKITADKISEINIPHKSNSWGSEVTMVPISEFIGQRFERMATEKNLDGRGKEYRRYDSKSGPYSLIEYLTNNYISEELNDKVIKMIQQAKKQAEETLINSLEDNLQQQLNADMIQRLNIPALLEQLQNQVEQIEGGNK